MYKACLMVMCLYPDWDQLHKVYIKNLSNFHMSSILFGQSECWIYFGRYQYLIHFKKNIFSKISIHKSDYKKYWDVVWNMNKNRPYRPTTFPFEYSKKIQTDKLDFCKLTLTWIYLYACKTYQKAGTEAHLPPSLSSQLAFKNCWQWLFHFGGKCLSHSCLINDLSCSTVMGLLFDIFPCHNVHYICTCRLL